MNVSTATADTPVSRDTSAVSSQTVMDTVGEQLRERYGTKLWDKQGPAKSYPDEDDRLNELKNNPPKTNAKIPQKKIPAMINNIPGPSLVQ